MGVLLATTLHFVVHCCIRSRAENHTVLKGLCASIVNKPKRCSQDISATLANRFSSTFGSNLLCESRDFLWLCSSVFDVRDRILSKAVGLLNVLKVGKFQERASRIFSANCSSSCGMFGAGFVFVVQMHEAKRNGNEV